MPVYMHFWDWFIVIALLTFIVGCAFYTKRYTESVADFLAANRCAGRYLLTISEGIAGVGAVTIVAWFEQYYNAGFTGMWWELMMILPFLFFLSLTGFVTYRFRETRALTLAQFFEARYSRNFRVFAGIVLWVSGIINFGIFPSVGARFFIHFCGLPETVPFIGMAMFPAVMLVLLGLSLLFVFLGGQIAVMITDFFQGMFMNIALLIMLGTIFWLMDWSTIVETLKEAPEGASRLNPYQTERVDGFNIWFFIIQVITVTYGWRAWQGSQAYASSAKSAHEARMAGMLGQWRNMILMLVVVLLPVAAYVVMHNDAFASIQSEVNQGLERINNPTVQTQTTVTLTLSRLLPAGVVGLFCAVMLAAFISTHDTYLHSWGSIFVQDVILPFRKKPFTPKQHILLLRLSIVFVAIFIFLWSMFVPQTEYIRMFFAISGAIWLGGAGAVIIGGLYWRRGSTAGAYAGVGIGAFIASLSLVLQQLWRPMVYPWLENHAPYLLDGLRSGIAWISAHVWGINWEVSPDRFPIDGQWVNFISIIVAVAAYVVFSVVSKAPPFNMDRMLHRGKYAVPETDGTAAIEHRTGFAALLPSAEFTLFDKAIYYSTLGWAVLWFGIFVVGTIISFTMDVSDGAWATFWYINLMATVVIGVSITIWFFAGGIRDIHRLFRTLSTLKRDHLDDGHVWSEVPTTYPSIPAVAPSVDPSVDLPKPLAEDKEE